MTKPGPPPAPATDALGRLLCTDSSLTLHTTTGSPTYSVGAQPVLGLTVTNSGRQPCVRDLSGPLQIYTAYDSSGARIWSTSDCFPGQGHDVRMLAPGQTVSYTIKWSGTTSVPGCSAPRQRAPAGKYTIVAALGALKATPATLTFAG